MTKVAIYTSPAHGHLVPARRIADALSSTADVHVRTRADDVEALRSSGLPSSAIAAEVEAIEMDDWTRRTPVGAVRRATQVFAQRAAGEVDDLSNLVADEDPDVLVIDSNCWGALAAAEASGRDWAAFQAYPTPLPDPAVPPFGLGLPPADGWAGRLRDRALTPLVFGTFERAALPRLNDLRRRVGLDPLDGLGELWRRPPTTLCFTSREFEHPRTWPDSFEFVGPAIATSSEPPAWLDDLTRPLILATCSTERQGDERLIEAVVAAFADADGSGSPFDVVITSGAHAERPRRVARNVRIEGFVPHGPLLERSAVVICHGGMGITQAALAAGVPVCVVPFGRDQPEVASRVVRSGAGVRLSPGRLGPRRLRAAVDEARSRRDAAVEVGASLRAAADPRHIVDALLPSRLRAG
jgi:UDP:flavonoid glycosyltransferase YjiC (YdhE family)